MLHPRCQAWACWGCHAVYGVWYGGLCTGLSFLGFGRAQGHGEKGRGEEEGCALVVWLPVASPPRVPRRGGAGRWGRCVLPPLSPSSSFPTAKGARDISQTTGAWLRGSPRALSLVIWRPLARAPRFRETGVSWINAGFHNSASPRERKRCSGKATASPGRVGGRSHSPARRGAAVTVPEPPLQSPGVGTAASLAPRGGDAPGERHTGLGTMGTTGEQGSGTQVSRTGGTGGPQTPLGLGVAVPSGAALHQQSPPWILGPGGCRGTERGASAKSWTPSKREGGGGSAQSVFSQLSGEQHLKPIRPAAEGGERFLLFLPAL